MAFQAPFLIALKYSWGARPWGAWREGRTEHWVYLRWMELGLGPWVHTPLCLHSHSRGLPEDILHILSGHSEAQALCVNLLLNILCLPGFNLGQILYQESSQDSLHWHICCTQHQVSWPCGARVPL